MAEQRLFCTFHIGQQFYGIPVEDVQEVLQAQPLTGIPLAPPAVAGLMNLRGQIVTAIDVRRILRTRGAGAESDAMNVVVRHEGAEVSLMVDRIGDVVDAGNAQMERAPETLQGVAREFIRGIFPFEDNLLLLLDVHRMLEDELCTRAALALE